MPLDAPAVEQLSTPRAYVLDNAGVEMLPVAILWRSPAKSCQPAITGDFSIAKIVALMQSERQFESG